MFHDTMPAKQLATWLCAAMIPAWIQLTAGAGWLSVAIIAATSTGGAWVIQRWAKWENKLALGFSIVFEVILLGSLMPYAAQIWPGGDQYPAVPLGILALAVWSAWKGPRAAASVGCVLFWAVLIVYLLILGAGAGEIQVKWVAPIRPRFLPLGTLVGILPVAAAIWKGKRITSPRLLIPALLVATAAFVTAGVLSPRLAGEGAFLELSRSLSLFGVARHFEAVASAAMTVGWFSLASVILSLCGTQAEKLVAVKARPIILLCASVSALWMLCEMHISEGILLLLGAVCWVLLPLLPQGIEREKKS